MLKRYVKLISSTSLSMLAVSSFAATPIHLINTLPSTWSQLFLSDTARNKMLDIEESKREMGTNGILHIELGETFRGYPIINTAAALHVPNGDKKTDLSTLVTQPGAFLTGIFYDEIEKDVGAVPANLTTLQLDNVITQLVTNTSVKKIDHQEKLVIYINRDNVARWAFAIMISATTQKTSENITAIVDAATLQVYQHHSISSTVAINKKLKSLSVSSDSTDYEMVTAGGIGGNTKTGMIYYDGRDKPGHKPTFIVKRDKINKICYLEDSNITVRDWNKNLDTVSFPCATPDPNHDFIYWNSALDETNGAYNPANDVYYAAQITRNAFNTLYHIPLWEHQSKSVKLNFFIHDQRNGFENGAWFSDSDPVWYVSISDGDADHYPFTSLDMVARFIGDGYKQSHSFFAWGYGALVGICYSFSDFFGKAMEYSINKENHWNVGEKITKAPNQAIRYMNNPIRDCDGRKPGDNCSIENVHDVPQIRSIPGKYSSGVLNKALSFLADYPGWNTLQVFKVMIQADKYYWSSTEDVDISFNDVGCGMLYAAKDFQYDTKAIIVAFSGVGVDLTKQCVSK